MRDNLARYYQARRMIERLTSEWFRASVRNRHERMHTLAKRIERVRTARIRYDRALSRESEAALTELGVI